MKSLHYLNAHRLHTDYKDAKPASETNLGNFEISPKERQFLTWQSLMFEPYLSPCSHCAFTSNSVGSRPSLVMNLHKPRRCAPVIKLMLTRARKQSFQLRWNNFLLVQGFGFLQLECFSSCNLLLLNNLESFTAVVNGKNNIYITLTLMNNKQLVTQGFRGYVECAL